MRIRVLLVALVLAGLAAAAHAEGVGQCTPGKLVGAWRLPDQGEGWLVPENWRQRGRSFGTASMISLIRKVAEHVSRTFPGSTLYIGDLSLPRGGKTKRHRTHREGRDVDMLFYALRYDGLPAPPPSRMIRYDAYGRSLDGMYRFDLNRNWELLRVLVEDPRVERLFVAAWIEEMLLAWGRTRGATPQFLARAASLMTNPRNVSPHDDHFHVRVGCERMPSSPSTYAARSMPSSTYVPPYTYAPPPAYAPPAYAPPPAYVPPPAYAPPPPAPAAAAAPAPAPAPDGSALVLDRMHPLNRLRAQRR